MLVTLENGKMIAEKNLIGLFLNYPTLSKNIDIKWYNKNYADIFEKIKKANALCASISRNELEENITEDEYNDLCSLHLTDKNFQFWLQTNNEEQSKIETYNQLSALMLEIENGGSYKRIFDALEKVLQKRVVQDTAIDLDFDLIFNKVDTLSICSTGYTRLDEMIRGGINAGCLYLIAGRTGMGKTTLAINLLKNIIQQTKATYYSYEMTASEICVKLASSLFEKTIREIKRQKDEYIGAWEVITKSFDVKINPRDINELIVDMSQQCDKGNKVFFIDNIGNMNPGSKTRNDHITDICSKLKNFAMDKGVCVILLSQINREAEKTGNKIPELSHLKNSGALEEYADVALLCFREGKYDKDLQDDSINIILAKNRYGQEYGRDACRLKRDGSLSLISQ